MELEEEPEAVERQVVVEDLEGVEFAVVEQPVEHVGCASCHCEFQQLAEVALCTKCNSPVCDIPPCNRGGLCQLCCSQKRMNDERLGARAKVQKQADKMVELSR